MPTNAFGQKTIHYISLDAEHAEVEILRVFDFDKWDVKVWVVEVQPDNFFEVDSLFLGNGYAKAGVLGGDHVYVKLGDVNTRLDLPSNWREELEEKKNTTHGFHT